MNCIVIKTDGNIDVKDSKRAILDYMKDNNIKFEYCNAFDITNMEEKS